ncbi:MAG TPA: pirin family protein [Blastocatellia bacterium]|nr:pirin family protein [Blastocatellia bacterium]
MIKVIKNRERFHFESDWLSTYWHFSFDQYYDPRNMNFGPLRVFNDDVIQPSSGFPTHAHREMEIVTYVIDGELEHKDSTGASDRIRAGEVQRMSAGSGIRHSEYNPSDATPVHLLQMWLIPAVENLKPSYEQLRFTGEQRAGRLLAIASGQDMPGAVKVHQDATFYVSSLKPGERIEHELGEGRRAYLFVIEGELEVNGERLSSGDQARIERERELTIRASNASEIMLIDLP